MRSVMHCYSAQCSFPPFPLLPCSCETVMPVRAPEACVDDGEHPTLDSHNTACNQCWQGGCSRSFGRSPSRSASIKGMGLLLNLHVFPGAPSVHRLHPPI